MPLTLNCPKASKKSHYEWMVLKSFSPISWSDRQEEIQKQALSVMCDGAGDGGHTTIKMTVHMKCAYIYEEKS